MQPMNTLSLALVALVALVGPALASSWPDLATPAKATGEGTNDAALVIGAEDYIFVPDVEGARKNADDWYFYLTRTRGISPASATLLRDHEATREKILKYAKEAAGRVGEGGTLWVVFIGHGAPAKDGKDGVLVGVDAQQDADSLYARSIRQAELLEALEAGKQSHTMVLIDACFSGRGTTGKALVPGLQPLVAVRKAAPPAKVTVMSAGKSDEFAGPLPGVGRPAFSYLALGALRGWGDRNGDGKVSAQELTTYTTEALRAVLKGRSQTPQLLTRNPRSALARSAGERAPDLAAIVVGGKTPEPPNPGMTPIPTVPDPVPAPTPVGPVSRVDLSKKSVSQLQGLCRRGDHEGCLALAGRKLAAKGTRADPEGAKTLVSKSCKGGHTRACMYVLGTDNHPLTRHAFSVVDKACNRDVPMAQRADACAAYGSLLMGETGYVRSDPVQGKRLIADACDAGSMEACLLLALVRPDVPRRSHLRRACKGGHADACAVLYGFLADQGSAEAAAVLEAACKGAGDGYLLASLNQGTSTAAATCKQAKAAPATRPGWGTGVSGVGAPDVPDAPTMEVGCDLLCAHFLSLAAAASFGGADPTQLAEAEAECLAECPTGTNAAQRACVMRATTMQQAMQCEDQ